MTSAHIGQRLKTLREYYCYTQKYVSSKINIERPSYSNYELGKRTPPLEVIITLADFYHISLDDLLCNPDFSPRGASPESDYDSLANDESILLNLYRLLPKSERTLILQYLKFKLRDNH